MVRARRLPRATYRHDALDLGPALLGKVLVSGRRRGRIVEVEAYRSSDDPASHAFRGPTARNATMFGPPGHLYVYFTYGLHWCANVVCGPEGQGQAVLLRALHPLAGLEDMRAARPAARTDRDLCRGPARLTRAFGLDGTHDGLDLTRAEQGVTILDDGWEAGGAPVQTVRVGITRAVERPWRWYLADDPHVSRR